jgi:hypothetical protein
MKDYWPNVLALAGGYIRATNSDLQTYLALFRDHVTRTHPVASSGETIRQSLLWPVSFSRLTWCRSSQSFL